MRLHPKNGVNARLTYCVRCGGDAQELYMVGAHDKKGQCCICQKMHFGFTNGQKCQNKECSGTIEGCVTIDEHEKLPSSTPCDTCYKEIKLHEKIVSEGGIYFKCSVCGCNGVIAAQSEFSIDFRKDQDIKAPEPCGVDFNGDINYCPKCKDNNESK